MKLYEIKLPAKIYCKVSDGSTFVICDHLDGMYSYCSTEKDPEGKTPFHLSVSTPLRMRDDGYEIDNSV